MPAEAANQHYITIREAAELLAVSLKTLRRWEKYGLVHPIRNPQNQRLYLRVELEQLSNRKYKPLPENEIGPQNYLSISQAADQLGVSIKTLRRWDAEGKLNLPRDENNRRVFTKETVDYIQEHRAELGKSVIEPSPQPADRLEAAAQNLEPLPTPTDSVPQKPIRRRADHDSLIPPMLAALATPLLSVLPFLLVILPLALFAILGFKPSIPIQSVNFTAENNQSGVPLAPLEPTASGSATSQPNPMFTRLPRGEVAGITVTGGSMMSFENILDDNYNFGVAGSVEGNQLISSTTVKPPLVVASQELVANLNADLLDGHSWEEIQQSAGTGLPDTLQTAYEAGNTITTNGVGLTFTLTGSDALTVGGSGNIAFTTTGTTTILGPLQTLSGMQISGGDVSIEDDIAFTDVGRITAVSSIELRPNNSNRYSYFTVRDNHPSLHFAGVSASNDPGIRVNNATGQIEYRDQNADSWVTLDSLSSGSVANVLTDGGTYLYPTNRESLRIFDATGTDYLDIAHDGSNVLITTLNTGRITINSNLDLTGTLTLNTLNSRADNNRVMTIDALTGLAGYIDTTNWDKDSTNDLTTGAIFSGDVSGTYNNLQLGDNSVAEANIAINNPPVNGYVLQTDASGNLAWADPITLAGAANYWQQTGQQVYPKNALWHDVLVGGTSTMSATIALQANTGAFKAAAGAFQVNNLGEITARTTNTLNGVSINSGTIWGATWEGNVIGAQYGGTGMDTSAAANGQLLIGNGAGFSLATLTAGSGIGITNSAGGITIDNTGLLSITGTPNQVTATTIDGAVTLALPQDINATASPTFAGLTLGSTLLTADASELNVLDGILATTDELNLLSGITGSILSTGNIGGLLSSWDMNVWDDVTFDNLSTAAASVLAGWDMNDTDDVTAASVGATVQAYNANTSFLGQLIQESEMDISNSPSDGYLLQVAADGTLTWMDPVLAAGGVSHWQVIGQQASLKNSSLDLMMGGVSTDAATIALKALTGDGFFTGRLGVGTTDPTTTLDVNGLATFRGSLTLTAGNLLDLSAINHSTTTPQGLLLPQGPLASLALPSSGVGYIAYDTTNNKVRVYNGTAWTDISGASTTLQEAYVSGNTITLSAAEGDLRIHTNDGDEAFFIREITGDVGIGTTTPTARLDVAGTASMSAITVRGASPAYYNTLNGNDIRFRTSVGGDEGLTERFTITNAGNVGIGTTNPGYTLDVSGSLNTTNWYINGSQVTATAAELNKLAGLTGSLVDTNNAASLFPTWDQNIWDDITFDNVATAGAAAGFITDGNTNWDNSYGFITADSTDTLTNKSGNISMWTNDSNYLVAADLSDYVTNGDTLTWDMNIYDDFDTASLSAALTGYDSNEGDDVTVDDVLTWDMNVWDDLDVASISAAGFITDGNTNWDNSYGFITSADLTDYITNADISTWDLNVFDDLDMASLSAALTGYDDNASDDVTDDEVLTWDMNIWDDLDLASLSAVLTGYDSNEADDITVDEVVTWDMNVYDDLDIASVSAAGFITDGNTGWDNSYGFITSADLTGYLTTTDTLTWDMNVWDDLDIASVSAAGFLTSADLTDYISLDDILTWDLNIYDDFDSASLSAALTGYDSNEADDITVDEVVTWDMNVWDDVTFDNLATAGAAVGFLTSADLTDYITNADISTWDLNVWDDLDAASLSAVLVGYDTNEGDDVTVDDVLTWDMNVYDDLDIASVSAAGFITADSTDTLTNKSGNISMWTNDANYITSGDLSEYIMNSDTLTWDMNVYDDIDIASVSAAGFITDGNTNWDNSYGFITSADLTDYISLDDILTWDLNIYDDFDSASLSAALTGYDSNEADDITVDDVLTWDMNVYDDIDIASVSAAGFLTSADLADYISLDDILTWDLNIYDDFDLASLSAALVGYDNNEADDVTDDEVLTWDMNVYDDLDIASVSAAGFITADSTDTLTNKSGNISMWTNDANYLTTADLADYITDSDTLTWDMNIWDDITFSNLATATASILANWDQDNTDDVTDDEVVTWDMNVWDDLDMASLSAALEGYLTIADISTWDLNVWDDLNIASLTAQLSGWDQDSSDDVTDSDTLTWDMNIFDDLDLASVSAGLVGWDTDADDDITISNAETQLTSLLSTWDMNIYDDIDIASVSAAGFLTSADLADYISLDDILTWDLNIYDDFDLASLSAALVGYDSNEADDITVDDVLTWDLNVWDDVTFDNLATAGAAVGFLTSADLTDYITNADISTWDLNVWDDLNIASLTAQLSGWDQDSSDDVTDSDVVTWDMNIFDDFDLASLSAALSGYDNNEADDITVDDVLTWDMNVWDDLDVASISAAGFITADSTDTLTNKSGNISMWTNDANYLVAADLTDYVTNGDTLTWDMNIYDDFDSASLSAALSGYDSNAGDDITTANAETQLTSLLPTWDMNVWDDIDIASVSAAGFLTGADLTDYITNADTVTWDMNVFDDLDMASLSAALEGYLTIADISTWDLNVWDDLNIASLTAQLSGWDQDSSDDVTDSDVVTWDMNIWDDVTFDNLATAGAAVGFLTSADLTDYITSADITTWDLNVWDDLDLASLSAALIGYDSNEADDITDGDVLTWDMNIFDDLDVASLSAALTGYDSNEADDVTIDDVLTWDVNVYDDLDIASVSAAGFLTSADLADYISLDNILTWDLNIYDDFDSASLSAALVGYDSNEADDVTDSDVVTWDMNIWDDVTFDNLATAGAAVGFLTSADLADYITNADISTWDLNIFDDFDTASLSAALEGYLTIADISTWDLNVWDDLNIASLTAQLSVWDQDNSDDVTDDEVLTWDMNIFDDLDLASLSAALSGYDSNEADDVNLDDVLTWDMNVYDDLDIASVSAAGFLTSADLADYISLDDILTWDLNIFDDFDTASLSAALVGYDSNTADDVTDDDVLTWDMNVWDDLDIASVSAAGFITADSTDTLTNKSGNISMWTNDANYLVAADLSDYVTNGDTLTWDMNIFDDFDTASLSAALTGYDSDASDDVTNGDVLTWDMNVYDDIDIASVSAAGFLTSADLSEYISLDDILTWDLNIYDDFDSASLSAALVGYDNNAADDVNLDEVLTWDMNVWDDLDIASVSAAGFITDGNTNWDNTYNFITLADLSDYLTTADTLTWDMNIFDDFDSASLSAALVGYDSSEADDITIDDVLTWDMNVFDDVNIASIGATVQAYNANTSFLGQTIEESELNISNDYSAGFVLQVNGDGTMSWADPGSQATNYWMQTGEQIYAKNALVHDILVGGTSTESATIALQANTGDASMSGSLVMKGTNPTLDILNGSNFNIQTSKGGDAGLSSKLALTNDGNLGLGTSNPTSLIDAITADSYGQIKVTGANSAGTLLKTANASSKATALIAGTNGSVFEFDSSGYFDILSATKANVGVGAGASRLRINSDGNIGIGSASITSAASIHRYLMISGTTHAGVVLRDEDFSNRKWEFWNDDGNLKFWGENGGNYSLVLEDGGNVGIGTTNPGYKLDVNGSLNATSLYLNGTAVTATADQLNLLTNTLTWDMNIYDDLDIASVSAALSDWDQDGTDDVTTFLGLTDTPNDYTDQATKVVRVNAAGTGLEFVDAGSVGVDTNDYVDGVTFTDGTLTLERTGTLPNLTVSLDGRYVLSSDTSTWDMNVWDDLDVASVSAAGFITLADLDDYLTFSDVLTWDMNIWDDITFANMATAAASILTGWDMNDTDDVTAASVGATVQAYNADTSLLGQTIQESELDVSNAPSDGFVLQTMANGVMSWVDPSTFGGTGFFQLVGEQISATNALVHDFLVGGTSTESATIALQANTGNIKATSINGVQLSNWDQDVSDDFDGSWSSLTAPTTDLALDMGTYTTTLNSGATTQDFWTITGNSLTTGTLASITSTSTGLTSGGLMNLDWSPSGSTEIFSDSELFTINVGQYGNVSKIFSIKDNGNELFSVSQTGITSNLPHTFTAAGDVSIANDLNFTNADASYIKTAAPFTIEAGKVFNSSNLTLKTYNEGDILLDVSATGNVGIGAAVTPLNKLHVEGTEGGSAGIYLNDASPLTTANTLYNDGGTLYFNGAVVGGSSFSGGYFQLTDQQVSPINNSFDVLIGGTSTASATIALQATTGDLLLDGGLYTGGTLRLSNAGVLSNVSGDISMFTNDADYISLADTLTWDMNNFDDVTAASVGATVQAYNADTSLLGQTIQESELDVSNAPSDGFVLQTMANGVMSWVDPSTFGGTGFFQLVGEQISATNALVHDFLVGGTSTDSATIALQANTGTIKAVSLDLGTNNLRLSGSTLGLSTDTDLLSLASNFVTINGALNTTGNFSVNTDKFFVDATTGNVGIGTTDPQAALDIAGVSSTITNSAGDITLDAASNTVSFSGDSIANVNDITAAGDLMLGASSYLNFGSTAGTTGYGIRDNGGTLQFKHSDGTWADIGSGSGDSFFSLTGEQLSPTNALWHDLMIGGTSTASAKIALQADTGVISLGTDNLYLDNNTLGISTDTDLLSLANNALTLNGSLGLGENNLYLAGTTIGLSGDTDLLSLASNLLTINGALSTTGNFSVNTDAFFVDATTGNVGIGTTNPTSKLTIGGASSVIRNQAGDITLDAASNQISFSGGSLINVNNITAAGNVTVGADGFVNFGSTAGETGYGIRDNAGTLQFKHSSGAWADIGSGNGDSYFSLTGEQLSPSNALWHDILVGGTSTASAKIALQADTGVISLGTNNLYLDNNTLGISTDTDLVSLADNAVTVNGSLTTTGNIHLPTSGYLNMGATDGSGGYGLRDNSGTLQYKNSGGAWADLGGATWSTLSAPTADLTLDMGTYATTFNSSTTTQNFWTMTGNSLTSGTLSSLTSTSTGLTTGSLMKLEWNPSGSTEIYSNSELFTINVGQYGNVSKIFSIKDNSNEVFSVSQTGITSSVPHAFTAAGDVSIANDLNFTNQDASYLKSNASLTIEAGEAFESNNLTLRTFNAGNIVLDVTTGGVGIGANIAPVGLFEVNGAKTGKALAIFNETGNQAILTASASGTTRFTVANNGDVTIVGSGTTCTIGNGTGATNCTSDVRLKDNVTALTSTLDDFMLLKPITFTWKDKEKNQDTHLGLIAQEVQQIYPDVVNEVYDGYLGIDYAALIVPTIQAVQELNTKLNALGDVSSLNTQVQQLDAQFSVLSADVTTQSNTLRDTVASVQEMFSQIASLWQKQQTVEQQTNSLQTSVTDLQEQVETLTAAPETTPAYNPSEEIATLSARLAALESTVNQPIASVAGISTELSVSPETTRLSELETLVASMAATLTSDFRLQTSDLEVPVDASTSSLLDSIFYLPTSASDSASVRTDLPLSVAMFDAESVFVSDFLSVMGDTVLTNATVTNSLNVSEISSLDGKLNLMAGLVNLDRTGNLVTIQGNLRVTGLASLNQLETLAASVSGTLYAADIQSPVLTELASSSASIASQSADLVALTASLSAKLAELEAKISTMSATTNVATPSALAPTPTPVSTRITRLTR